MSRFKIMGFWFCRRKLLKENFTICEHGSHLVHVNRLISNLIKNVSHGIWLKWPSGFREEDLKMVDGRRRMDDGACLYLDHISESKCCLTSHHFLACKTRSDVLVRPKHSRPKGTESSYMLFHASDSVINKHSYHIFYF